VCAHILNYAEYMSVDTISARRKNTTVKMIWIEVVSMKKKNREIARLVCL
jgi:hypothetical protein